MTSSDPVSAVNNERYADGDGEDSGNERGGKLMSGPPSVLVDFGIIKKEERDSRPADRGRQR